MEVLRIKCPSCSIILDVKNSKNEAVKRITCPNCKSSLAVTFHELELAKSHFPIALSFYYGEAHYELKEGVNIIGRKHPTSKADIQIATGDPFLRIEHASVKIVRLKDGGCKCVVKTLGKDCLVVIEGQKLTEGDEVLLNIGGKMLLGDSLLLYKQTLNDK